MSKLLSYHEAYDKAILLASSMPKPSCILPLTKALGYTLSDTLLAKKDLPAFDNAALDGFAIKYSDNLVFDCMGTIFAGSNEEYFIKDESQCFKIMTGAPMPNGADSIVPFEDIHSFENNILTLNKPAKKGNAFRLKSEEVALNKPFMQKGTLIRSSHTAMLASQGISYINVVKKPRIAILSSGNELKEPWENAKEKEIYNVNTSAISSLLSEFGFESDWAGVTPDNLEDAKNFINSLYRRYDVVAVSGGISAGDADFTKKSFEEFGLKTLFHGVNIKPGKPLMVGSIDTTLIVALPGNPLAAYLMAYLFLIPMLRAMIGLNKIDHKKITTKNSKKIKLKGGRVEAVFGNFDEDKWSATLENKYGSGMITPLMLSNSIYLGEKNEIEENEIIKVYPLFEVF